MPKRLTDEEIARRSLLVISEEDWERTVLDLVHTFGYTAAGFRSARRLDGTWVTPVKGDGTGFPDWIFAKEDSPLIAVELKSDKGTLSPRQIYWRKILCKVPGIIYVIWRPCDYEQIVEFLTRQKR